MTDAERLAALGRRARLPQPISWVGQSLSTNADLRAMADAGAAHGTGLLAHEQTAGRGRLGRSWQAPAGQNLTLSVLLRPKMPANELAMIVLAGGVAAVEVCGAGTGLKWPNDVLSAQGLKLAGLLAEAEFSGPLLSYLVVGIGINVNWAPPDLPATCLREIGGPTDRLALAVAWTDRLLHWVEQAHTDRAALLAAFRAADVTVGRQVRIGEVAGEAVGIDDDGSLRVRTPDGAERRIVAGDVQMVG